jgi:hypothetical protein
MKTKSMFCSIVLLLVAFTGSAFSGIEGNSNTFYGAGAGASTVGDNDYDTFIGANAGYSNTTGYANSFLGNQAGYLNTTGNNNTFLGYQSGRSNTNGIYNTFIGAGAGYNNTTGVGNTFIGGGAGLYNTAGSSNILLGEYSGYYKITGNANIFIGTNAGHENDDGSGNIFLGFYAGYNETGSNKLYIDNSSTGTPLIYGEFDNRIMTINGNLEVIGPYQGLLYLSDNITNNTNKVSRMVLNHYSNAEEPVYLFGAASTSTNNFVAFGGGNTIGNAATQIDLYTAPTTTTLVGTPRITIKGNGYVGIGTQSPSYSLQMAGGAYSNGTSWIDISSREYKENIEVLSTEEALEAIKELNPVKYAYKTDQTEKRVGFISEEVPELVSMKDRKGLSPMDIIAVLTKVVQEQQGLIKGLQEKNEILERRLFILEEKGEVEKE